MGCVSICWFARESMDAAFRRFVGGMTLVGRRRARPCKGNLLRRGIDGFGATVGAAVMSLGMFHVEQASCGTGGLRIG